MRLRCLKLGACESFALFTKRGSTLHYSDEVLTYPACWSEEKLPPLKEEFVYAIDKMPANSSLLPWLKTVIELFESEDRIKYLNELEDSIHSHIHPARFASYQSIALGLYHQSLTFFQSMN